MEIRKPILQIEKIFTPLLFATTKASFPSPADDYIEKTINLHDELVHHPVSTFFIYVHGDSMKDAGILDGDLLVVDKSLEPKHGMVVVAIFNGEFTVKYFHKRHTRVVLVPANSAYSEILIFPYDEFEVWGVVTSAIHNLLKS